jgi:hypothetical protein
MRIALPLYLENSRSISTVNAKRKSSQKKKKKAAKFAKRPAVADTKPRRTRMIKKKVPPSPPLPQKIQDEVIQEAYADATPSEGAIPEAPEYEKEFSDTFYPLPDYIDEAEGPDNKQFKKVYEGILKQIDIFQDPVEVKTFLKEARKRRKVLIDIPYESIEEIPNDHGVLLIMNGDF